MTLLDKIQDYRSLKNLTPESLELLASEIREMIISVVLENGGHLASSLGTVELILALLRSFDPLEDRIIFDVGHQAYAYKILTGRKDRFSTLRQWEGISGFPKRGESPCDHFDVGHCSTSLSAALGYAKARDIRHEKRHVVAVIGDASLLNGLAFEALNYTREAGTKVIFVLNDNTMSINPRVGGLATHLARLSSSTGYTWLKKAIKDSCASLPRGQALENVLGRIKDHIKSMVKPPNIFDEMDINYWGPFDGHNVEEMEDVFELAKKYDNPVLLHMVTVKGKGFEKAEENPTKYHGVSPPPAVPSSPPPAISWSEAASEAVFRLAEKDERIVCLTAAMKSGSRLDKFAARFPDRFFDVGIAEGHMITMAAGMAAGGLLPVVFIYSTFLQRGMDQLVHDVAMQNLPVIFAVDRAGLVGEDGETHHGLFDISWSRAIPNLTVTAPRDVRELEGLFSCAVRSKGPFLIRFPRGKAPLILSGREKIHYTDPSEFLRPEILEEGSEWALLGYGRTVQLMLEARAAAEGKSLPPPTVVDLKCVKPLYLPVILDILRTHSLVVSAEDGYLGGGVGEAIASAAKTLPLEEVPVMVRLGVPDLFVPQGMTAQQDEYCGLTPGKVVSLYGEFKKKENRQPAGR